MHPGVLRLMREASDRQKDEPVPRLYGLVFSLFSTQDLLQVLERCSGNEQILSQFLHPPDPGQPALVERHGGTR